MVPRSPTCSVPNPLLNRDEVPALVPYCTHPGAKVTEPSQSTEAGAVGVFTAQSVSKLRFFIKDRTAQWHVAGLNAGRAKNIMEWREKNGPFINHGQLKEVKDVGPTTFQQCAGFIRINPENLKSICRKETLDILGYHLQKEIIIDGLTQPQDFDIRQVDYCIEVGILHVQSSFDGPDFKHGIVSINYLKQGTVLTGRVENAALSGAFVDIGVGRSGLIHKK
ncbi:UNVERIFIED_CONTAM: hypothetical protein FKN15_049036 [Acipenser sinensis]